MARLTKEKAEELVERYERLDSLRGTFKSHLNEIATYMMPWKASLISEIVTPGEKRTTGVYDTTAIRALRISANGLYGHLTSPSAPWFEITTKDRSLARRWEVKDWLRDTTIRMTDAINSSNFGMMIHETYADLLGFGNGVLYEEEGRRNALNFKALSCANVIFDENPEGEIDTAFRKENFTARQCVMNWGDRVSDQIRKEYEKNKDTKFQILHVCIPRVDWNPRQRDNLSKKWASYWIEKDTKNILHESGFDEFPFQGPRWAKDPNEIVGRGPGMDALPDVKMLNEMSKSDIKVMQKLADPPVLVPDELRLYPMRLNAGGINYYKAGAEPKYMEGPKQVNLPLEYENQRRKAVMECFFADLFLLLAQNPSVKTATEVYELVEERLVLLGPTLGRLQSELYDPMLSRCFWILYRAGYLAPPPRVLIGAGLEVNYISKLALRMRQHETVAVAESLSFALPISERKPEVIDVFNFDNIVRGVAERKGVPVEFINSDAKIRQLREQRAAEQQAAAQAQQQAEAVDQAAKIAPAMTKAIEPDSPIDRLGKMIAEAGQQ